MYKPERCVVKMDPLRHFYKIFKKRKGEKYWEDEKKEIKWGSMKRRKGKKGERRKDGRKKRGNMKSRGKREKKKKEIRKKKEGKNG